MAQKRFSAFSLVAIMLFSSWSMAMNLPDIGEFESDNNDAASAGARAVTTWSGNVWLNSSYSIAITDELIVSPCTQIWMDSGTRIFVDGRLTIEGTIACPAKLQSQGTGDHWGIRFNSSSYGRGSVIDNLTINNAIYGITVFSSNPLLNNVTVNDADEVGIDLFNGASPRINDLIIDEGGQDFIAPPTYWRYGIGMSVGNYSTPIVNRVTMNTLVTSGINFWLNGGGLFNNITISNVTGGINAISVGVWIMDSRPLFQDLHVEKCDNGIYVRHNDDSITTRAVLRNVTIEDSMYRGLKVDKLDGTNYTNYQAAVISDLTITGTGGPGAKTQGLAQAALEVNASGIWLDGATITDNDAVGIRLYFVDWNTEAYNVTIERSGKAGGNAHAAGLTVRSSYFAPKFNDLSINDSEGVGIWSWGGGALQGNNWNLSGNTDEGLYIDSATVWADSVELHDNGRSGVRIENGRNIELSHVNSSGNGDSASSPDGGAGYVFIESNDVESQSGDVHCYSCTSLSDNWGGVWAKDSVDLSLDNFEIRDPDNDVPAIVVNNAGLTSSQQGGWVDMTNIVTWTNGSSNAIKLENSAAQINGLEMFGAHSGLYWNADHNLVLSSNLSNAKLSGSGNCVDLSDHSYLMGTNVSLTADCTGTVTISDSQINWSGLNDITGNHVLILDENSDMRLHRPVNVDISLATLPGSATIGVAWDYGIWVVNQLGKGIPSAEVEVNFDQLNQGYNYDSEYIGYNFFPNYLGQVWTSTGSGPHTTVTLDCEYDNTTNSTSFTLNQDWIIYCRLDLANQAPFLIWSTPEDGDQYASGSIVEFNASETWDLDNDEIFYNWTSSIDGDLFMACSQSSSNMGNKSILVANENTSNAGCLSDGMHDITLEVCDEQGSCASETREIELTNLPPIVSVETTPQIGANGILRIAWTQDVHINASSTYDPEGDELQTTIEASGCFSGSGWWNNPALFNGNEMEWNVSFSEAVTSECNLAITFSDGVNPSVIWTLEVELENELPNATFQIIRTGNTSEDVVTLDGSSTIDPEGDTITVQWIITEKDQNGLLKERLLHNGTGNESLIWTGNLFKGAHTISLYVGDVTAENAGLWNEYSQLIIVENSPPRSIISSPLDNQVTDSSTLLTFTASGSGDWDSWCETYPNVSGVVWHCSPTNPTGGSDFPQVKWESNISGVISENLLNWTGRLEAGNHTITFSQDDGNSEVTFATINLNVAPSAPVLGLFSPTDGDLFTSDEEINWDASGSIDYDGDNFTMTVLDEDGNILLENVDSRFIYNFRLPSGQHTLTAILSDETGMNSSTDFTFQVYESGPYAGMLSPENGRDYPPSTSLTLSANASVDWDNDISSYEWYIVNNTLLEEIEDCNMWCHINLAPGDYHIALLVTDTQGDSDWAHANISLLDSAPVINDSSLWISNQKLIDGQLEEVTIKVEILDGDGTLQNVKGTITHGIQFWEFTMNDNGEGRDEISGDGIWTGMVEIEPDGVGRPFLKIIAIDEISIGQDEAKVDSITADFVVDPADEGFGAVMIVGSVGSLILLVFAINFLVSWRRKRKEAFDEIESWTSFGDLSSKGVEQVSIVEQEIETTEKIETDLVQIEEPQVANLPSMPDLGEVGKDLPDLE